MRAELENLLSEPNIQKFLDMTKKAEGTAKYADPYRVAGGGKVTLTQLDKYEPTMWDFKETTGKKNKSSAAGAYQVLKNTYDDVAPKLGLTDFSPRSQDLIALELMRRNNSLDDILKGDFQSAIKKNNKTWASFPGSPYDQPKRGMQAMMGYLGEPKNKPDPTPAPVQLARAGAQHTPQPTAPDSPALSSDQNDMLERIIQSGAPDEQQTTLANIALRLPQLTAPDLFGADLPNTLDPELMNIIETA